MKSKTSFFNETVFARTMTRFWPVWAIYLLWLLLYAPFNFYAKIYGSEMSSLYNTFVIIDAMTNAAVVVVDAIASLATALAVFSFLYSSKSANAMASLPIKREGMFLSSMLAGAVWLIGANVIAAGVTLVIELAAGTAEAAGALSWIAAASLRIVFFYGLSCFLAMLTGNGFVLPIAYIGVNSMFAVAELCIRNIASELIRNVSFESVFPTWLIPVAKFTECDAVFKTGSSEYLNYLIPERKGGTVSFDGWATYLIYGFIGILMLTGGLLLHRKRRMESAGDVISFEGLKPIFKYFLAVMGGLCFGQLLYAVICHKTSLPGMLACTVAGTAIGYYVAAMLNAKSFRAVKRGFAGFVVAAAVMCALVLCVNFDVLGIKNYVPESELVESATVYSNGGEYKSADADGISRVIRLQKMCMAEDAENNDGQYLMILYKMKNGRETERYYYVKYSNSSEQPEGSAAKELYDLVNDTEALLEDCALEASATAGYFKYARIEVCTKYYDEVAYGIDLDSEAAYRLYTECVLSDIADGTLGKKDIFCVDPETPEYTVNFAVLDREEGIRYYSFDVTKNAERTYEKIGTLLN